MVEVKKKVTRSRKKVTKHNGIVSFWKFMFCLMVIIHHSQGFNYQHSKVIYSAGSIGVEFFFIVSGYLLASKALSIKGKKDFKDLGKETFEFIFKKVKTFLPFTILSGILCLIVLNMNHFLGVSNNLLSIIDILLLDMTGIKGFVVNGPLWYISSMLIAMFILYPLLRRYKENFIYICSPIIFITIFSYITHKYSIYVLIHEWDSFTYCGNLRAIADLSLGTIVYLLSTKLSKVKFTKFGSILITLIELLCFISPFVLAQFRGLAIKFNFISIIFMAIAILLAFSEKTIDYKFMCNKVCYWLEKMSLSLYMFHYPIGTFMLNTKFFTRFNYIFNIAIFILITLIISVILTYILEYLKKKNYFIGNIKKIIIES